MIDLTDPKTWPYPRLVIPRLRPAMPWNERRPEPIDKCDIYEDVYEKEWMIIRWSDGTETKTLAWKQKET